MHDHGHDDRDAGDRDHGHADRDAGGRDHDRDADEHAHAHAHGDHDHGAGGRSMRGLTVALLINTAFFVVELAGALYANSLTLLADAGHMITDSGSLALALFAAWAAARPADRKRTYGYQRAEILGALANGVFLLGVVAYILYEAVVRFQNPPAVRPLPTIAVGVIGLGANLAAAYALHGGRENLNVRGAYLHLLADAAGSVAAVVLGVALLLTDLYVLDPLFSLVIAALVLYSAKDLLADSVNILLQGVPGDVRVDEMTRALLDIDGVLDVHDVHVWALTTSHYACSAHVVVTAGADRDAVLEACRHVLGERFDIEHATVQVERPDGTCETADFDCYVADVDAG